MGVCCGNRVGGGGGVTCVGEWGFLVKTTRMVEAVVIELVVALEKAPAGAVAIGDATAGEAMML